MRLANAVILLSAFCCCHASVKVSLTIGVVFDEHAEETAILVSNSFTRYAEEYYKDVTLSVNNYDLHYITDITVKVREDKLAALIVAAEKINCVHLNSLKHILPIYVISGSSEDCNSRDGNVGINYLFPPNPLIISAILKATHEYGWTESIVLEQASEEIHFSFADMQYARENGLDTIALEASADPVLLRNTLKASREDGVRSYILACPIAEVLEILRIAEELELLTDNYHWFIPNAFVTPSSVDKFMRKGFQISYLYSPFITPAVEYLLAAHNDPVQETVIINDVIAALGHHALHVTIDGCLEAVELGCLELNSSTGVYDCYHDINKEVNPEPSLSTRSISKRSVFGMDEGMRKFEKNFKNEYRHSGVYKKGKKSNKQQIISCIYLPSAHPIKREVRLRRSSHTGIYTSCLVGHISQRVINFTMEVVETHYGVVGEALTAYDLHDGSILKRRSLPDDNKYFTISSNIDSCALVPNVTWSYQPESCSMKVLKNYEIPLSSVLMILEYTSESSFAPLVSGIYRNEQLTEVNLKYKKLLYHDISLPERPMRIGVAHKPPWLFWSDNIITGERVYEGFLYDVLLQLSAEMNFEYEFVLGDFFVEENPATSAEEIELEMINLFANNTCDFFLYPQIINGGRLVKSKRVDISNPYQTPRMYLLTKRLEKSDSIDIWQFMLPFRQLSWVVFWSTFIIISLLLAYINKNNPNEYAAISTDFGPNSGPEDHLGIMNSLWFNYAAIAQQGADIVPRSKAAKCLTATWWAFVLLVLSAYTANMTSFMTQNTQGTIETLEELANQQEINYGITKDNAMMRYLFPNARDKPFTTIYSYLKKNTMFQFESNVDALNKLREGNFYVISTYEMVVAAMDGSCEFDVSGPGFYQHQFGLPFPKGSIFTPLFDDHIKRMRDSGVFMELEEKWFDLEAHCEADSSSSSGTEGQLDLRAFIGMYVFLLLGICIGIGICLLETGWIKCGGLGGFFGKAKMYEIEKDQRGNIKKNAMLEEEFKSWEGGWDVWKFKEWNEDLQPQPTDKANYLQWCHICGRPAPEHESQDVIKVKQEIVLSDRKYSAEPKTFKEGGEIKDDVTEPKPNEAQYLENIEDKSLVDGHSDEGDELSGDRSSQNDKLSLHNVGGSSPYLPRSSTSSVMSHSSLESGSILLPPSSHLSTPTTVRRASSILTVTDGNPSPSSSMTNVSGRLTQLTSGRGNRHRRMESGTSRSDNSFQSQFYFR